LLSFSCQQYVVTAEPKGSNCPVQPTRSLTNLTYLDVDLPCGNAYNITVRAVTKNKGSSADKQTSISIPSQIGRVRNLLVKFIPANNATRNNATDVIKQREDGFWLTWAPPANEKPVDFKVGNKLQPVWLFNRLPVWNKRRVVGGLWLVSAWCRVVSFGKIILLSAFLLPCL